MRLTHIKLAGFKSFTDPTTIHVPGQLVAVIGPNGCGKSNVIDAVRWVLGESSAKQLRGENMQDVIFNGAATRRPAPRASVELVFDNSSGSLQGEWGRYSEISVKRQLTRQGDSSYFINGQTVRRRDITDLFLGTGVGTRGYAVIEQGMISRIIEARPEELRSYIEEAAGVSKYKERRRETEARLKDSREHLQRLADLQSELSRQIDKLHKQAATAERYRSLNDTAAQLRNLSDYIQWQQALNDADTAAQRHQEAEQKALQQQEQTDLLDQTLQTLRQQEQDQQQYLHDLNRQAALLREHSARLEEQIRAGQNRRQRIERERSTAQQQLQKIAAEQTRIAEETGLLQDTLGEHALILEELALEAAEQEQQLPELEQQESQAQQACQAQQEELNRIQRELAISEQHNNHRTSSLNALLQRQTRLQEEAASLALPDKQNIQAAEQAAAELQEQYRHSEAALHDSEQQLAELKQRQQTAQTTYQTLREQHLRNEAHQQALSHLLQSRNQDNWSDTPFADSKSLWQHIRVPQEWQHALAAVLSERLHARSLPQTGSDTDRLPTRSAAWINVSGSPKHKQQPVQALIHQIHAEPEFQTALQHWLDGILCAPDLHYALSKQDTLTANQQWLTPEGHLIDRYSVTLNGDRNGQLLQQQTEYDRLTQELARSTPKLHAAETELQRHNQITTQHQIRHQNLSAQNRRLSAEAQQAQNRLNHLRIEAEQNQLRHTRIQEELAHIAAEQHALQYTSDTTDTQELQNTLHTAQQHYLQLTENLSAQQHAVKQARLSLLDVSRRQNAAELNLHKTRQQTENLQQQHQRLEEQKQDWQERQNSLELEETDTEEEHIQYRQLEELTEQSQALQENIQAAQTHLRHIQDQTAQQHGQLQQLNAARPHLQDAVQAALLARQQALLTAKQHHDKLQENGSDIEALAQQSQHSGSLNYLQSEIRRTEQHIQSLGAVNLAALDELNEAAERDRYYRSQSDDIQNAITLLEQAIGQIDEETKIRFKNTFDAVNEKVQTFFPTLFGGGEAQLHTTGDDWLNAGVSIMARPPGKKNSTIHLLSGGEKALTAMSLVFALFSLNPAPFCLLDEVDAPLDDANTARFCNLVKKMSENTQFLYISHNRLTMEMAEQLIGVTMQEKGVSRIVAVDIKQALEMAEAA